MYLKGLLQKDGWHDNVAVTLDKEGVIVSIADTAEECSDYVVPGFRNCHSHAFQYAMAGIAENHTNSNDDFWSWRKAMYELALTINPEQLEHIATMLYSEMLRHGHTHVVEFHYLHHNADGKPYDDPAEMSVRLINAAAKSGISITVVPVYYRLGGFGEEPAESQRRFLSADPDNYLRLVEAVSKACNSYKYANYGIGIHSLRAASAEDIIEISENGPRHVPFHIHIAEQKKEVEDCLVFYGKRPVEWLLEKLDVNTQFNLVHATHLLEPELKGMATSGANVVLCPTTEGNLGDGMFSLKQFKELGGRWSLGTDSNVSLNPFEELRLLDYGQRLISGSRNTFGERGSHYALESAFDSGGFAIGHSDSDFFEIGMSFNGCIVSSDDPFLQSTSPEYRLNTIVYSLDESIQKGAIANGKHRRHHKSGVERQFVKTLSELKNR